MIPQETVNRILDAAQIVDVVGDFVTLKKRGANHIACCPFHNEKTPSFSVSASKGIYKCFGCGKSGTAVGFVMEHENMTYVEALKYLARKYHIEVVEKEESAEEIAQRQRHESLLLVSEFAGKFFQDSLGTQEGQAIAYQYFRSRGLEDETIRKYGLGWAPLSRKALSDKAREAGYKEEFLIETGLSIKYDDGRLVDRFYDRVMFPIHSVSGRVIAFGGRTLKTDKSVAKYVNSPETEIYVKSKSLYGIYFAKNAISKHDRCILVEGYLDVLSMHQLGITNVVASSGTSLTVDQIRLIRKFTSNVTIIYDGDGAGIKAALRGIGLVLKEGMNVKVVLLPDGQDPDDFARRHTLEEVEDYISRNEQDFIGFKTDLLLDEAGNDPIKRAGLINDIADTIALIPDAVVRAVYVKTSAAKFDIDEQILAERVSRSRTDMILADRKQLERQREVAERGRNAAGPVSDGSVPPTSDMDYMPAEDYGAVEDVWPVPDVMAPAEGMRLEEPYLAPCERDLLKFILEEGCTALEFDRDSKFYVEGESFNVAEFIDGILADDDASFVNTAYRIVYDEYFRMYDEGLSQQQIQTRLLNSMDAKISDVAKELLIDKYQITVKNYEQSLTAVSTRLVQYIPKTLMTYQCKKVELILKELTAELASATDPVRQVEIMEKMGEYNRARTRLNNELGRV
ncbi:MAG: DNA primase [Bacteroidales bacterium]|nr:DNA primase [Bacteroidales bacterium]MBQ9723189.1 DNA primase [Bacteroidales bacterium]